MSKMGTQIYKDAVDEEKRQELVMQNLNFVKHILGKITIRLPSKVDMENLEAAGVLGLVEASHQFDSDAGVTFQSFAYHRVRGAIIDELRRNSPLPQKVMNQVALVRKSERELEPPHTVERLAEHSGLSVAEVENSLNAQRLTNTSSLNDHSMNYLRADGSHTIDQELDRAEKKELLTKGIEKLPEQQRVVLTLYYAEDLRLKEIGKVLKLSESRISRVLARAEEALRQTINPDEDQ